MEAGRQVAAANPNSCQLDMKMLRLKFPGCHLVLRSHPSCTQDVLQDLSGSWLLVFVLLQQVVLPSSFYNLKDRSAKC